MTTNKLLNRIVETGAAVQKPLYQWYIITRLVGLVFPAVKRELRGWEAYLKTCPPSFLLNQALHSIKEKRFHCQGGAVYALFSHTGRHELLSFITAFQTISDYLDNLCDRLPLWSVNLRAGDMKTIAKADAMREQGFRALHGALQDALEAEGNTGETEGYYGHYPFKEDGGYLQQLVQHCRKTITQLPSHAQIQDKTRFLSGLYCDLQTLKHLSPQRREKALQDWARPHQEQYFYLYWYEFAAAAGSTLGIFALMAAVSRNDINQDGSTALFNLYFPWICGLHILLDYYIDQAEDRLTGDLNFVAYYEDSEHCLERIRFFIRQALLRTKGMPHAFFHRSIIKGLPAFYLSDPKIQKQGLEAQAHTLLRATGERDTFTLYHICCLLRRGGWL